MITERGVAGPKKAGIVVSKCYNMLCGSCGKRFTKIMLLELTGSAEDSAYNVFDIQSFFNSVQNHEYECPFCWQRVQIILNETLIVGDSN